MRYWTTFALKALALIALASPLGSCSITGSDSKVEIRLPNWQALREADLARQSKLSSLSTTASNLEMVVITVSGPGTCSGKDGAVNSYTWEAHNGGAPESRLSFTIPYNTECFVQIMAMYGGEGLAIYYDGKPALFIKDGSVTLEPVNVTSSSNVIEGRVSGRFVDANGNGPTGRFLYQFQPSRGPRMRVHHGEIFAGWASVFALNSPLLVYTWDSDKNFADVEVLKDIHNASAKLRNANYPQRSLSVKVPKSFEERHEDTTTVYIPRAQSREVVGFFGEGAGNKKVCYLHGSSPVAMESLYLTNSNATPIMFTGTTSGANSASVEYGGSANASDCTGGLWVDYMVADPSRARDSMVMFEGPFAWPGPPKTDMIAITDAGTDLVQVAWKLLPGVASNLDGISVFYREWPSGGGSDDDIRENDSYKCSALESLGFTKADVSRSTESTVLSTPISPNSLQVVLCARRPGGGYFASGTRNHGSGPGGGMPMATKLSITPLAGNGTTAAAPEVLYQNGCYPVQVSALTSDGQTGSLPPGISIQLATGDASNDYFYWNYDCTMAATNPLNLNYGGGVVFVKTLRGGTTEDFQISATSVGTSAALTPAIFYARAESTSPEPNRLDVIAPSTIKRYGCYPVTLQSRDSTNNVAYSTLLRTFNLDPSTTGLQFYQSGMCDDSPISPYTELGFKDPEFLTTRTFYFRYLGTGASITLQAQDTGSVGWTMGSQTVSVTDPGPSSRLMLRMASHTTDETCEVVRVELTDDHGFATMNDTGGQIGFETTGTDFYDSTDCSGSPTTVFSIANGDTMKTLSFLASTTGQMNVGVEPSSGGLSGYDFDVQVAPAPVDHIIVEMPGETFDPATLNFSGNPYPVYKDTQFTIRLFAMTAAGKLVTNYAETNLNNLMLVGDPDTLDAPASVSFSGGIASVVVKFTDQSGNLVGIMTGGVGNLQPWMSTYTNSVERALIGTHHMAVYPTGGASCTPILIVASNGPTTAPAHVPGGMPLSFAGSTDITMHAGPTCAGGSVSIPDNSSAVLAYATFQSSTPSLSVTSTDLGLANQTPSLPGESGDSAGVATALHIMGATDYLLGNCQAFAVIAKDAYEQGVPVAGARTIKLTSDNDGKFYNDGLCTTGASDEKDLSFAAGDIGKVFYFRSFSSPEILTAVDLTADLTDGSISVNPQ